MAQVHPSFQRFPLIILLEIHHERLSHRNIVQTTFCINKTIKTGDVTCKRLLRSNEWNFKQYNVLSALKLMQH